MKRLILNTVRRMLAWVLTTRLGPVIVDFLKIRVTVKVRDRIVADGFITGESASRIAGMIRPGRKDDSNKAG